MEASRKLHSLQISTHNILPDLGEFDDYIPMTVSSTKMTEKSSTSQVVLRRSTRQRYPPDRLIYHS